MIGVSTTINKRRIWKRNFTDGLGNAMYILAWFIKNGEKKLCNKYWGIALLDTTFKILFKTNPMEKSLWAGQGYGVFKKKMPEEKTIETGTGNMQKRRKMSGRGFVIWP